MLGEKKWQLLDFFFVISWHLCSFFVCYITRFTEECFACLIAIIFIIKAVRRAMMMIYGDDDQVAGRAWQIFDKISSPPGAEHGQDRLHLPDQPKSLPLCAGQLHTPHVRRNLVFLANLVKQSSDLTFSLQRLVDGTLSMVQHDSGIGQRKRDGGRICFHSSWDQEHQRLPTLDKICWRVCRIF